ncbi:unnamed protein product [marine sediment metagenome]|uniref:Uncharacterized protein n=1 Tax=marine sediment metagenome TaxID=412755 RepID=X1PT90_9ZZZZ
MPIAAGVAPVIAVADRGKATRGSLTTLVDTSKSWPVDIWRGCALNLFLGSILATHRIASNTADTLTFEAANVPIVAGVAYFIVGSVSIQAADVVIAAQVAGVYLQPEWATKEGQDKNFYFHKDDATTGIWATGSYRAPVGKTLYITSIQAGSRARFPADRDLPQHLTGYVYTSDFNVHFGGNGGAVLNFTNPLRVDAEVLVVFYVYNQSNHECAISLTAQGYEI